MKHRLRSATSNRPGDSWAWTRWQQLASSQQGSLYHRSQASIPGQLAVEPSCLAHKKKSSGWSLVMKARGVKPQTQAGSFHGSLFPSAVGKNWAAPCRRHSLPFITCALTKISLCWNILSCVNRVLHLSTVTFAQQRDFRYLILGIWHNSTRPTDSSSWEGWQSLRLPKQKNAAFFLLEISFPDPLWGSLLFFPPQWEGGRRTLLHLHL